MCLTAVLLTMCLMQGCQSPPSAAQNSIFNIHVHGYGSWPIMVHQLQQAQKQHLPHWAGSIAIQCAPTPMFIVMAAGQLLSTSFNRLKNSIFNTHVHGYGSWSIIVHQLQQAQKQHLRHPCSWSWQLANYCPPASTGSKTASSTSTFMVMSAGPLFQKPQHNDAQCSAILTKPGPKSTSVA